MLREKLFTGGDADIARLPTVVPLLWENLVTDGHVLAARMRRIAPWLLGSAIVLLVLSIVQPATGLSSPWAWKTSTTSQIIEERRSAYMQPLVERLNAIPTQQFTWNQIQELAPANEIPSAIETILASLNKTGDLPQFKLFLKKREIAEFWNWEWVTLAQTDAVEGQPTTLGLEGKTPNYINFAKGRGDTYVFGTFAREEIVDSDGTARSKVVRWVGIARKLSHGWKLVSVNWPDLYVATEGATAFEIPTSMRLALNLPEPE